MFSRRLEVGSDVAGWCLVIFWLACSTVAQTQEASMGLELARLTLVEEERQVSVRASEVFVESSIAFSRDGTSCLFMCGGKAWRYRFPVELSGPSSGSGEAQRLVLMKEGSDVARRVSWVGIGGAGEDFLVFDGDSVIKYVAKPVTRDVERIQAKDLGGVFGGVSCPLSGWIVAGSDLGAAIVDYDKSTLQGIWDAPCRGCCQIPGEDMAALIVKSSGNPFDGAWVVRIVRRDGTVFRDFDAKEAKAICSGLEKSEIVLAGLGVRVVNIRDNTSRELGLGGKWCRSIAAVSNGFVAVTDDGVELLSRSEMLANGRVIAAGKEWLDARVVSGPNPEQFGVCSVSPNGSDGKTRYLRERVELYSFTRKPGRK